MIHLTDIEERLRVAAVNLILKRKKEYTFAVSKDGDLTHTSIIADFKELVLDNGKRHYMLNGILIAITSPLVKIYFMSNDPFDVLKSNRDMLDALATYIERNTLRVV